MNAFDTNILLYAIDDIEPPKQVIAVNLLAQLQADETPPILLWQVLCEYLGGLRRRENEGRLTPAEVQFALESVLATYPLAVPTDSVIVISNRLFDRYSLSHWDSLLLAACINAGVTTLYSEDMAHGMTYGTVTVINPFKTT